MAGPGAKPAKDAQPRLRVDKWLWQARFFKSRHIAADMVERGRLRLNGNRMGKPGHAVTIGDVLTFPQGDRIRVVKVTALGHRRGPAEEAADLYDDLDPQSSDVAPSLLE